MKVERFLIRHYYHYIHVHATASVSFIATEAHDDDGLPHTLEHLVFLGSEDYPFKVQAPR